ncbi:MAG TPA: FecR domain-containing protein [Chryseosolibacter sp.]
MAPKDLDKLIEKYLEGTCSKEERAFIDSLYSNLGSNQDLHSDPRFEERITAAEKNILHRLQQGVVAAREGSRRKAILVWTYTGIAASLILAVSVALYFLPAQNAGLSRRQAATQSFSSIENTSATDKRVILPDGSIVEMSPASRIRFPNDANMRSRELYLEGEAYFDVAHDPDRPFYVYAGDIVTKVVGTSFTVTAIGRDPKVTVSVKTGKVTVYSKKAQHKKTVLVSRQEAVYNRETEVVATHAVSQEILNKQKQKFVEMHFEEAAVPEVLAELTKTYDIDIVFNRDALSGCVLTSSFLEEGLYDRIDVICTAIGATYKIDAARIVIESNGCNIKPKQQ